MELAERVGPDLAWWMAQPYALALWAYRHLQENDRRTQFVDRMARFEAATLMNLALNDPPKLLEERARVLAGVSSVGTDRDTLLRHGHAIAAALAEAATHGTG